MALNTESSSLRDPVTVDTQWGITQIKQVKIVYTWVIDGFSYFIDSKYNSITSPTFTTKGYDDIKWCILLESQGEYGGSGYVSLFLKLMSSKNEYVKARVQLSLLNTNQEEINTVSSPETIVFCANCQYKSKDVNLYGEIKYINRSSLLDETQNLLPEDKLTVLCKVVVMIDTINTSGPEFTPQLKIQRPCISDDFVKLFEDMKLSDVTLVAGRKKIRAHKVILAAHSPVFAAMFEADMQEQKLSRVDIPDVDHDTLREMLQYMYTNCTPNIHTMAADILVAADKYALDGLKLQCEEYLLKNLSIETATDTLILADLHSAALLKKHTIAYINSHNADMVIATEGWKKMTITYPHLVAELFRAARGN